MAGKELMEKYWLPWLVGMPAECSFAACSLIFGGVMRRLPKLRSVLRTVLHYCGRLIDFHSEYVFHMEVDLFHGQLDESNMDLMSVQIL